MGHRGKLAEREKARELRSQGMSLLEIAQQLNVSKSSVSLWVRDLDVKIEQRRAGWWTNGNPHPATIRKHAQIEELNERGIERLGQLSEQAFLAAGAALYAGEGAKTDGGVGFANSDAAMVAFFCRWLRRFFDVDESRLRVRLYLHEGLDLEGATRHWSRVTGIPASQFTTPYRAVPDEGYRAAKHVYGCGTVTYSCSRTHREVMGLVRALLSSVPSSGVAQSAARRPVKP